MDLKLIFSTVMCLLAAWAGYSGIVQFGSGAWGWGIFLTITTIVCVALVALAHLFPPFLAYLLDDE